MRVLDLFSGLGGFSKAFKDHGHEVVTVDIEPSFNCDITKDVFDLKAEDLGYFDVILASPPCNNFSVLTIGRNWKHGRPRNEKTLKSLELVKHTIKLIEEMKPKFWILENPVGMLRKQNFMNNYNRRTITQCQYGRKERKATDLWGSLPKTFIIKKCNPGSLCHTNVRRGEHKGIQGTTFNGKSVGFYEAQKLRALIPYGLSLAICEACERELK